MRRHQHGVAAITAILIVAVAASAATYMLAQQSATLNQAALVGSRAQSDLYAQAGFDWARGILAQDLRTSAIDSLDEGWAQPIAGLPVERAVISGAIEDAQSRYNLNNLVTKDGKPSENDRKIFQRLLAELGLNPDLAWAVLDWIDDDSNLSDAAGAENAYYLGLSRPYLAANRPLIQVEELYRVRGFDAATVEKLRPFVSALPAPTAVNANTASAEVLAAVVSGIPLDEMRAIVATRRGNPFKDTTALAARMKNATADELNNIGVASNNFMVRILVAQDDVSVASEALVTRVTSNATTAIIWRRSLY
jgi:general secretion pathway protein K